MQFIVKDRISALDAMKHDYFFCLGKHVQELKNSKFCNIPKFQELSSPCKTRLLSLLNVDRDVNCSFWFHVQGGKQIFLPIKQSLRVVRKEVFINRK